MVIAAIVLFILAAILGLVLLTYILSGKPTPKGIAFIHGPVAVIGLILLIIYALTTTHEHKHLTSITIFVIAAAGGVFLFYRDITGRKPPKWLAVLHGLLALSGIVVIIYHTVHGH